MSARPKPPAAPERPSEEIKTKIYDPTQPKTGPAIQAIAAKPANEALVAISMKTPTDAPVAISMKTPNAPLARPEPSKTPMVLRPKLRAMSEVAPSAGPQDLGNLAPPYDPNAARIRTMQDYIIWGCIAVILASAITLVIWFVAR